MNFSLFGTGSTNIWPLANDSWENGQLMTEYNLRSRECVGTDETVDYMFGPSYCHNEESFYVRCLSDSVGNLVSTSTLEITEGRAVVNGHYIESLTSVSIDLLDVNTQLKTQNQTSLSGALCVGLRAMYSTEATMAGAMLADKEEYYEGIQVVILPPDEFKLPSDVPNNEDQVTAHLLLATFNFINGSINTLVNNYPDKCQWIEASRIDNVDGLLSDIYVKKTGLNSKKLYTFSGKGTDPSTGLDTWCDSLDSLMVWDNNPQLTLEKPTYKEATFATTTNGTTQLRMPHKQVDGMTNTAGDLQYYEDKIVDLPLADYHSGTAGTVNKEYTDNIKAVAQQLQDIYRMPNGKQVGFLDSLESIDDLPPINPAWEIGDYIVVMVDSTVIYEGELQGPSSMYVVLPGTVEEYTYHSTVKNSSTIPSDLTGIELANNIMYYQEGVEIDTTNPEVYSTYFNLSSSIRGEVGKDYFVITLINEETSDITRYYYVVSKSGDYQWSDTVWLTSEIQLAQEDLVGGFYNVPDTYLDNGYVYLDDTGHLVLLDYALLRSGTLAYQLGEDYTVTSGLAVEEIQGLLDDYVNDRVAFPNANQMQNVENPKVITITIPLSEEDEETTLNIYNIDSRFNTSVYLYFTGTANSNTTINIYDCEKVRIYSNIGGTPVINLYRSCLYYDSTVLEYLNEIEDMTLWYEKYEDTDPNLLVDSMTVMECDSTVISDDLDYWNEQVINDNHFMFALRSLTFGPDGSIIGIGIYVRNETSANLSEGDSIVVSNFELPQGAGLEYPPTRLTNVIKVTGTFVNAYAVDNPAGYMVLDTNFSLTTNVYDEETDTNSTGVVAFHVRAQYITNVVGIDLGTSIDCWESNAFHHFEGVCIG